MTTLLILLLILSLIAMATTIETVANDGHRTRDRRPSPRSHPADLFEA